MNRVMLHTRVQYNSQPFSNQVMLLTDQCNHWSAICADHIFHNCNYLLSVFIICIIIVIIIVILLRFLIKTIQLLREVLIPSKHQFDMHG